jgi:hypothetical protein
VQADAHIFVQFAFAIAFAPWLLAHHVLRMICCASLR